MRLLRRGFTLIELMVSMALGLMVTVVIAQVFLQSEGNKRTTTSGSDAQVSGSLALFTIQRDLQMAGYGLSGMAKAVGCPTNAQKSGTPILTSAPLVPVLIGASGAASVSDTVTVFYSRGSAGFSVPLRLSETHAPTDSAFVVPSTWGVATNDLMVAVPGTWAAGSAECTLFQASSSAADSTTQVQHAVGKVWNTALSSTMPTYTVVTPDGPALLNLGSAPVRRTYSVNAANFTLQSREMGAAAAVDLFPQIVLLKALYGKATIPGGPVTVYDAAQPVDNAGWRLVQAIRLVVVARSGQREREAVSSPGLSWDVGPLASASVTGTQACNGTSKCLPLDLSAAGVDEWQHYRYKVFDTVIPLRNAVWNQ